MTTAGALISRALRLIGVISQNETPSAGDQAAGLEALNSMRASWSNEGLMIPATVRETFVLTPGKQVYSLGVGGDFDTERPMSILNATIETPTLADQYTEPPPVPEPEPEPDPEDPEEPVEPEPEEPIDEEPFVPELIGISQGKVELPLCILNLQQWAGISVKGTPSTIPTKIYVEDTSPLKRVYLWPVPSAANSVVFYSDKALLSSEDYNSEMDLPPGYDRAIAYNLALELAPEYGREPSALVMKIATESKAAVMRTNTKPVYAKVSVPAGSRRTFNILTGE